MTMTEVPTANPALPLAGLKVVEFTHMVMGPAAGVILADLGAEVTKIEPVGGDPTRELRGSGAGYFVMYNRNKQSCCLDLKSAEGLAMARRLAANADIVIENFRPGALDKLGLGSAALRAINPRLIYCSAKGFLPGPYEKRTALDEVAQMMGGLAYMTGPPGRPLRAGASVIDVMGGMFGVIGILAALERRHATGEGSDVACSLYETTAYLMGQHMAQNAITGVPPQPMPNRISAWAIYDVFDTANNDERVFVGVVSDSQWQAFCAAFDFADLAANADYALNNQRVAAREAILPLVRARFAAMTRAELLTALEDIGLPFAPIQRPDELDADPHLNAHGLLDVALPQGGTARLPALPLAFAGQRPPLRSDPPAVDANGAAMRAALG
jgi:crotonobetainyl-CoA:carnitine CoA-transferase CaiB-like acyl-CoA transferase